VQTGGELAIDFRLLVGGSDNYQGIFHSVGHPCTPTSLHLFLLSQNIM
jgi:hypothetical protein